MPKHNQTLINISLITLTLFIVGMVVWSTNKKEENIISKTPTQIQNKDSKISEDIASNDNEDTDKTNDLIPISDKEPIVIASDIDTSDWKTYRNEEFGFEFRYPNTWTIREYKKGEPKRDPTPFHGLIEISSEQGGLVFFIVVDNRFEDIDVSNLTNEFEQNYLGDGFNRQWNIQSVQVADINTKKYSSNNMGRIIVPLVKDSNLIAAYWNLSFADLEVRPEETFNAILSSFQL